MSRRTDPELRRMIMDEFGYTAADLARLEAAGATWERDSHTGEPQIRYKDTAEQKVQRVIQDIQSRTTPGEMIIRQESSRAISIDLRTVRVAGSA